MLLWVERLSNVFKRNHLKLSDVVIYLPLITITVYLLMPYKPWSLPFSIATMIVAAGVFFLLKDWKTQLNDSLPKLEKIFFLLMVSLFTFSALIINSNNLSKPGLTAYFSSFLTFLFVRLTISKVKLKSIYGIFSCYLIATGFLILFEMLYGHYFFLSNFFIADYMKIKGYRFGSGFAPYASLAGGLILWPLSVIIAKYSLPTQTEFQNRPLRLLMLISIGIGAIALFYTLARASWVGLFVGLTVLFISLLLARLKLKQLVQASATVILVFFAATTFVPHAIYYNKAIGERIEMTIQSIPQIFRFSFGGYAEKLAEQKTENAEVFKDENGTAIDTSANTRIQLYKSAVYIIEKFPAWGIGIDHFPLAYQEYYNSLDATARLNMDPTANLDAHNFILTYLVESGIIPSIPFFAFILYIIILGISKGPRHQSFPFLIGMISVCSWMIFTGFVKERLFWLALATLAGLICHKKDKLAPSDSVRNRTLIK
ncbi:MAG: O-antigen ligase family protein [Bdellovibrionaceae bacterium]|nr:O-antigen ligase family protein [Bdellovibrio sp.]